MTHAIIIQQPDGPEEMRWEEVQLGAPGPGEVRLSQSSIGLNYIDCYHRSGLYPLEMPHGIGMEAAGTVDEVGDGVIGLSVGDRVAYACPPPGAYAQARNMPADKVVKLPHSIDNETASAMMLQGMTVQYLIRSTYRVKSGETVLFHAAAGGVGPVCRGLGRAAPVLQAVGGDPHRDANEPAPGGGVHLSAGRGGQTAAEAGDAARLSAPRRSADARAP